MLIGAIGTWYSLGGVYSEFSKSGLDSPAGKGTFFMGLVMLYSAIVNLGYVKFFRNVVPVLSTAAICGLVSLILSLSAFSAYSNRGWGLYLTALASLISLFAAFRAYGGKRVSM